MNDAIGRITDLAERINSACDAQGLALDSPKRERMHRYHGEMVARGADAEEVMRVVNSALGVGENAATD